MPLAGEVWLHSRYYFDNDTGAWRSKFLLVLGMHGGDIVYRLLTSRRYGRPHFPPCFHGDPYPGFYLGVLGGPLTKDSWLDLREEDDLDPNYFVNKQAAGLLTYITALPTQLLCPALRCAAQAPDTTKRQAAAMYATRAHLGCTD